MYRGGLLRDYDTFARIGGEEFAILLPATDITLATKIAERIRQAIHSLQIKFEDQTLTFTTSIGLLESTTQISSFEQMMQIADKYLNQAKSDGRNKILCG
ncbi:GGDEF domain-containing protein [Shewanella aestuarii]|uniref:diguanylate cyclase n=1 Tax=Shewanella aestuarii TaxID=1028752 RepID=A0A6G9QNW2_9GAMM|nr:GGDEF domain-containing protein [Shewanella aestuarii]